MGTSLGPEAIPQRWLDELELRELLVDLGYELALPFWQD